MSGWHPSSSSLAICQVISWLCFSWICSANIRTLTLGIDLLPLTAAQFKNRTSSSPPLAKREHLDITPVSGSTQHVNQTWRRCQIIPASCRTGSMVNSKTTSTLKKQLHPAWLWIKRCLSTSFCALIIVFQKFKMKTKDRLTVSEDRAEDGWLVLPFYKLKSPN